MGNLVVFGQKQAWGQELEILINHSPLGIDCVLTYKDGESRTKTETRHNCTEFHHRFDSFNGRASSAFESDIHSTGGTVDIDRLESIEIRMADRLNESY